MNQTYVISMQSAEADDGTWQTACIISGLADQRQADAAESYLQSLLCGPRIGGLPEGDAVIAGVGDVDQRVSVAAPGAQEVAAGLIDLGLHSPEHDLKTAVSALPHGAPPARDDYVRAAQIIALAYGRQADAPAYLPRTDSEAARFEPHAWVLLAMMQAYADGKAVADGRIAAVPELLACVRDLVGQITAFAEQHGEADFETGRAIRLLAQLGAEPVSAADELAAVAYMDQPVTEAERAAVARKHRR